MLVFARLIAGAGGVVTLVRGNRYEWVWLGTLTFLLTARVVEITLLGVPPELLSAAALLVALLVTGILELLLQRWPFIPRFVIGFVSGAYLAISVTGAVMPWLSTRAFLAVVAASATLFGVLLATRYRDVAWFLSASAGSAALVPVLVGFVGVLAPFADWIFVAATAGGATLQLRDRPPMRDANDSDGSLVVPRRFLVPIALVLMVVATSLVLRPLSDRPQSGDLAVTPNRERPALEFATDDRVLVLAPHPDDESVGAGAAIQAALEAGAKLRIVFLTAGDFNETSWVLYNKTLDLSPASAKRLAVRRHQEALNASKALGVAEQDVRFLGYPDSGMLRLFLDNWGTRPALRAPITGATRVPYAFAVTPGAPYRGESVLADLQGQISDFKPTKVIVSHPGDVHPDHQALYLFTRAALWNWEQTTGAKAPELYSYLIHYGQYSEPRSLQPELQLQPPAKFDVSNRWRAITLDDKTIRGKQSAIESHKTQMSSGGTFLVSFIRATEPLDPVPDLRSTPFAGAADSPVTAIGQDQPASYASVEDRRTFVDLDVHDIQIVGSTLYFNLEASGDLRGLNVHAYLVGWRPGEFRSMPKLNLVLRDTETRGNPIVLDREELKGGSKVDVRADSRRFRVAVPLDELGAPEKILLGATVYRGATPVNHIAWVAIDLSPLRSPLP